MNKKSGKESPWEGVAFNDVARFDHDFVQDDAKTQQKEVSPATMVDGPVKSEHGSTLWNGKMILMSGLSRNALEELSSERDYDDQIPHFFNMLGFVFLKDGNSLIAIGGLWETTDRFRKGVVQAGGFANSRAARFLFPASKGTTNSWVQLHCCNSHHLNHTLWKRNNYNLCYR